MVAPWRHPPETPMLGWSRLWIRGPPVLPSHEAHMHLLFGAGVGLPPISRASAGRHPAAQHRGDSRRRLWLGQRAVLRRHRRRNAKPRPAEQGGTEVHAGLCARIGLLAHPLCPHDRPLLLAHEHQGWRGAAGQRAAAHRADPAHARLPLQRPGLPYCRVWQMAPWPAGRGGCHRLERTAAPRPQRPRLRLFLRPRGQLPAGPPHVSGKRPTTRPDSRGICQRVSPRRHVNHHRD